MPAQLVALNDGPNILLDKPILLLGRHPECDIQIDSRKISRRHCCIAQVSDYLVVRDLGSTNGIRINGVRVQEGRLAQGDELTIGNHRYQVRWDAAAAAPVPRAHGRESGMQPQPGNPEQDELLESCEEPVPLDEPPRGVPFRLTGKPPSGAGEASGPPSKSPVILPDHLELAPSGEAFPHVPPPPASGSHHPS